MVLTARAVSTRRPARVDLVGQTVCGWARTCAAGTRAQPQTARRAQLAAAGRWSETGVLTWVLFRPPNRMVLTAREPPWKRFREPFLFRGMAPAAADLSRWI